MTSGATHPTVRGTVALLALLAALVGYLALVESPHTSVTPVTPAAPPLLGVPAAAVARVDVDWSDGRLTALRRAGGWTDVGGRPWHGDALDDLLETLGSLRPLMVVDPDPRAPDDYGLGAGTTRVAVVAADGARLLVLDVGERNPAWTGLYVRRAGEREVILVGAVLAWDLAKLHAAAPALRTSRAE